MVPDLDRELGMLTYLSEGEGVGGRIRERLSDFVVDEVLLGRRASRVLLGIERFPSKGSFTYLVAAKFTKMGTRELASLVGRRMGGRVRYAGLKDARAITFQFLSIEGRGIRPGELRDGIWVRPVGRMREPLSRGRNDGNHFTVVIRGARPSPKPEPGDFPNFFSYQRFGVRRPFNHHVGRAILLRDLDSVESMMSDQGYRVRARSLRQLAEVVGTDLLRFYVHAYQSYLFNLLLSKRLMELGADPVEGDFVIGERGEVSIFGAGRGELALPVPGAYTRARGWVAKALEEILREEGVSLDLFLFREVPEISALGDIRAAIARPVSPVTVPKGGRVVLSFFLGAGVYATSLLREVMKPRDPASQGFC